ncbi:MAG: cobalamin biosynthesis protein CobD [Dehalococcoidia bacterium]|nr:cobalamin biosynthesis protein CobD [Dehalococcoidia bacterium]
MWHEIGLNLGVLGLAAALDLLLGEPPAPFHPVVWMGKLIGVMERLAPRKGRTAQLIYGALMAASTPAAAGALAFAAGWGLHAAGDVAYVVGGAVLMKTTFSVRMLARATRKVGRELAAGDLQRAQQSLTALVSRDTATLSPSLSASATIESAAENTTDSFVAPWLAFALFGLPGAFAYRAINTMDAMIGYHGAYEYLGKAAARLDDLVNLVPARLAGLAIVAASALTHADAAGAWRRLRLDHARTESPNSGWTMSAMAGALRVRLEKPGHYVLNGDAAEPQPRHVAAAVRITWRAAALSLILAGGIVVVRYAIV